MANTRSSVVFVSKNRQSDIKWERWIDEYNNNDDDDAVVAVS